MAVSTINSWLLFCLAIICFWPIVLISSHPFVNHLSSINNSPSQGIHAVLVAGTSGWSNYRHQSDVAHGYQVLVNHGVLKENIIVMMVNDVAYNDENPFQGQLFNTPNSGDVNAGLQVDYSGDEVSAVNFLNILKGVRTASMGKVLNSSSSDTVLVYISSYGATGLIGFPNDILTSASFNQALIDMYNGHQFGRLMVFLDSDDSGSMFSDSLLSANINVYSVTSTSAHQVNYACFCNTPMLPFTCLASSYSALWFTNLGSKRTLAYETLSQQFDYTIESLHTSFPPFSPINPRQFGDLYLASFPVGLFMGLKRSIKTDSKPITVINAQLSSFDVPLEMARQKALVTNNEQSLLQIINSRRSLDRAFYRLIDDLCWSSYCTNATDILSNKQLNQLTHPQIYSQIVTKFHEGCLNLGENTYAFSKMYAFANIVDESRDLLARDLSKFLASLHQACRRRIIGHGFDNVI